MDKKVEEFLKIPGVVGIGIGKKIKNGKMLNRKCITVFVEKKLPKSQLKPEHVIPKKIGNTITDVVEIGHVKILKPKKKAIDRKSRLRPFPMGVSIAHYKVTAGTAGLIVYPRKDFVQEPFPTPFKRDCKSIWSKIIAFFRWLYSLIFRRRLTLKEKIKVSDHFAGEEPDFFILSNNHVLANSQMEEEPNIIGDYIVQPGPYDDSNWQNNVVGRLYSYIPLKHSHNIVDCALCKPFSKDLVKKEIVGIGLPQGVDSVKPGDWVIKSGRTTGITRMQVLAVHSTINVDYDEKGVLQFDDCIVTTYGSEGGDSISHDSRMYWKSDDILKFGTIKELYDDFKSGKSIKVLSLSHKRQHPYNKKFPSIKTGTIKWANVTDAIYHGVKPVFKITLHDGKAIKVTEDHSLFSCMGLTCSLKPVKLRDLINAVSVTYPLKIEKTPQYQQDFLEFVGLWLADGSWIKDNKKVKGVSISTGNEKKIVKFLQDFCKKRNINLRYKSKGDYRIYSVKLVRQLLCLGLKPSWTSYTKRVPSKLFTLSDEEVSSFLRGYFSGDGSTYKRCGRQIVTCASVNRYLLEDIQILLGRLGIRSNIDSGYIPTRFSKLKQYKLRIEWSQSVNLYFKKIGFIKSFKYTPRIEKKQEPVLSKRGIRDIEFIGFEPIYDLKVNPTESFVANGILCHNSGSAGLREDNKKVFGLLFAGSDKVTIFCDIRNVFEKLHVRL